MMMLDGTESPLHGVWTAVSRFKTVTGPPQFDSLAPDYFVTTCNAIAELVVSIEATPKSDPSSPINGTTLLSDERKAFQNVLCLILAGLHF